MVLVGSDVVRTINEFRSKLNDCCTTSRNKNLGDSETQKTLTNALFLVFIEFNQPKVINEFQPKLTDDV